MKKILVVVDYQKDFVNGSLGFDKAITLEKGIYQKIKRTNKTAMKLYLHLIHMMTIISRRRKEEIYRFHIALGIRRGGIYTVKLPISVMKRPRGLKKSLSDLWN